MIRRIIIVVFLLLTSGIIFSFFFLDLQIEKMGNTNRNVIEITNVSNDNADKTLKLAQENSLPLYQYVADGRQHTFYIINIADGTANGYRDAWSKLINISDEQTFNANSSVNFGLDKYSINRSVSAILSEQLKTFILVKDENLTEVENKLMESKLEYTLK
ncbi:MAG: hypothetical protein ACRCUP_04870 [Mycoplasmatales bacterium]